MKANQFKIKRPTWLSNETIIHIFLWILYFMMVAYEKDLISERTGKSLSLQFQDFVFTLNYFFVIIIINYFLLPQYFYRKRYVVFGVLSLLLLCTSILIEEFVMERIFYGDTRGSAFQGFFPTLLDIGPTILFFVGFKLAWDNQKKQADLEQIKKEKIESELQFLKTQLNPHFLFNNLNNLYAYALEQSPKTPEIILQLSAMMRYVIYESRENFVPLQKELKYLKDFILLQKLQMESRGEVDFEVKGAVQGKRIAPLIMIAFVENSFKHSMSSQAEDIWINIKTEIKDQQLFFNCQNSFEPSDNTSNEYLSKGIGLENVKKRLNLLYPNQHQLHISQEYGIYKVALRIELNQ